MSTGSRETGKLVLTGAISLIVGVSSGLVLDYFRTKKPRLEFETVTNSVFVGTNENIAILSVSAENSGAKELEDFTFRIEWKEAALTESIVSGLPSGKFSKKKNDKSLLIEAPYINPTEIIRTDLLLTMDGTTLSPPLVEVRAKGIVGKPKSAEMPEKKGSFFASVLSAVAALTTASLMLFQKIIKRKILGGSHSDDQRDITAYILDVNGLHSEAEKIRHVDRDMSYWGISDSLTQRLLDENNEDKIGKLIKSLEQLVDYASITKSSRHIVNYNLARLHARLGDKKTAKAKLEKALNGEREIITKRISFAPELMNLEVI